MARSGLMSLMMLLLLGGCLVRGTDTVRSDDPANALLATTVRHGLFLTTVQIGGREAGPFLIDSGSNQLVLDAALAETLPLRVQATTYYTDARQTVRFATAGDLAVGPILLRDPKVMVMDLSHVTHGFGERLAGVLGFPFFAEAVVEIDYVRQSVSCFDPARYRLPGGAWQSLLMRDERPGVRGRLEGGMEGVFLLDTGSNIAVGLFPHFLRAHPGIEIRNVRPHRNLGIGGERDVLTGQIAWFEVGGRRLERPWVDFEKPDAPNPRDATWFDGVVGEGALRDLMVVFNYAARTVAFLPASPTSRNPRPAMATHAGGERPVLSHR